MNSRGWVALGVAFALCAGCTVGPAYVPPRPVLPGAWQTAAAGEPAAAETDLESLARWWTALEDPLLTGLIERAVAGNRDLRKAQARVREARARRGASQAGLFPTLDATGSATHSRSGQGARGAQEQYSLGLDAGWEVDLFGGVRRSVEAADATIQANQEDLRNSLVSLVAEVALNYIEVRAAQARIQVAEANLDSQTETCRLVEARREAGLTTALDAEQARYSLESIRAQIPTLRAGQQEAMNSLALLLGEAPGGIRTELQEVRPIPTAPLRVAVGVPADVLRRRPDVRQAERALAAQTAQVGVATAELYPKLSLLGSIGLEATALGSLFTGGSRAYSLGPSLSWRLFDAGAVRRNIEVQSALQEQALIAYEATVLTALKEVETALAAFAEEQQRRVALRGAAEAAARAVELARAQYGAGMVDYRSVLEAERSRLGFQDQLAQSEGSVTADLVRLYKALGGGWTSLAPEGK